MNVASPMPAAPVPDAPILEAPILEAQRVSKRFGRAASLLERARRVHPPVICALDEVSLAIRPGETFSIVGESGSGKSTLARCLTALHACDGGRVLYRGRDLAQMPPAERRRFHRRVQMVFQNPLAALNPRMTVSEMLREALRVHDICPADQVQAQMRALLERVRLPVSVLDRRPHQFSGGQLQRIAMARALSVRPEIIVADEVVSALDVSVQAQIVNLLITLQDELGLAIVFIAHDLRLVRHISHRVAVMYRGTLVEFGDSEALFTQPLHPYTRLLVGSAPTLQPGHVHAHAHTPTGGTIAEVAATGCVFRARCPDAMPRCAAEAPGLRPIEAGRAVACHLFPDTAHPAAADTVTP
ncbi:oligopeptide/dipeptide ABC transporter ATP-binding protein [Lichenicola sp.]|uniref:oligopeptide/dipeptide ABC transporter ATP-binding protein n=1 Tax=Lichenicola sp. TaxID=2804529 RepID=UPI003B00E9D6